MRAKKGITGEELGGERRKRLHAKPTILEICVYIPMNAASDWCSAWTGNVDY